MLGKFAIMALLGAVAFAQEGDNEYEQPDNEWDLELSDESPFGGSRFGGSRFGGPRGGSYFERRPSGPTGRRGPRGPRGPGGPRGGSRGYPQEAADENPKDGDGEVDPKASWYSQYSQYSPPAVRYQPAVRKPTFTMCELQAVDYMSEAGTIQLAQWPGSSLKAKFDITGMDAETDYKVFAHKFGVLGENCEYIGPDYNPLFEVDSWGRPNPYQDPSRGRFPDITSDDTGAVDNELVSDIMQNLAGPTSLIGRSLVISIEGEDKPRACCTVGRAPNPNAAPKPKPQPAYNPYYGHYYGGYRPQQYNGYQGGYQGGYRGGRGGSGRGYYSGGYY